MILKSLSMVFVFCIFLGCAKRAEFNHVAPKVQKVFGATVDDQEIDLNHAAVLKPSEFFKEQKNQFGLKSKDWLELSGELMEAGDAMPSDLGHRLSVLGHKLGKAFYDQTRAYTTMTGASYPAGNPYLRISEHYAEPLLIEKISSSVNEALRMAKSASGVMKVTIPQVDSNSNPNVIIGAVIAGLTDFQKQFFNIKNSKEIASGQKNPVADQIYKAIQEKFLDDLTHFKAVVEKSPQESVTQFMTKLRDNLDGLVEFSASDRKKLVDEVVRGRAIAMRVESLNSSEDSLKLITDLWNSKQLREIFPFSVRRFFQDLTTNQIMAMATQNKGEVFSWDQWEKMKSRTDFGVLAPKVVFAIAVQNRGQVMSDADWAASLKRYDSFVKTTLGVPDVKSFAESLSTEHVSTSAEAFLVLASSWLNLSYRLSLMEELRHIFQKFSDAEVQLLGDSSTLKLSLTAHVQLAATRSGILSALEKFGKTSTGSAVQAKPLQSLKKVFDENIVKSTQSRVNSALLPIANHLGEEILKALTPQLNSQISDSDKTATETFRKFGRYYVGTKIFDARELKLLSTEDLPQEVSADNVALSLHPLPLIEKEKIRLSLTNSESKGVEVKEDSETSPELLGFSLKNLYYRLKDLEVYESFPPESHEAIALQFQALCKLFALAGFSTPSKNLVEGLTVSTTPGHVGEKLDMKNYNAQESSFSFPDVIKLTETSTLDLESERSPSVSVAGQMELLSGIVKMIKYFKPWKESSFDFGLAKMRVPEAPTLQLFSKEDMFTLSIGLSSVILKNIPAKMLGVLNQAGDFVDATRIDDLSSLNPIAATLTDYTPLSLSHRADTKSVARAMIAISDFLNETADIERDTSELLSNEATRTLFRSGREKMRRLLLGLSIFTTRYLTDADGGFSHSYNLDKSKISNETRNLEDQILMQSALIKVATLFESDFFLFRALDNFYFLNKTFWEPRLGFYDSEEIGNHETIRLVHVARLLKNMQSLKRLLSTFLTQGASMQRSFNQIQELEKFLGQRFFSSRFEELDSVSQVLDFSL